MKNNNVNKDLNKTIVNFKSKFEYVLQIMLYITKIKATIRTLVAKSAKRSSLALSISCRRLEGKAAMHGYQPSAPSPVPAAHMNGLGGRLRGPLLTAIGRGVVLRLRQYAAVRNYVSKAALLEVEDTSTRASVAPASKVGTGDNQLNNSSNGINQIMAEITNNPMYIYISQILNSSVDGGQKVNNRKNKNL